MKKIFLNLSFVLICTLGFSQVGIGTKTPNATLEVAGKPTDATALDGIILPRLTGNQLQAKTYTAAQTGTQLYVTAAATSPAGQTVNVTASGIYFFNGAGWVAVAGGSSTTYQNIYNADGTLTAGRTVTQGGNDLVFSGSAPIWKFSGAENANSYFRVGRTVAEADFGVAGVAGDGLDNVVAGDFWMKVSSGKLSLGTSSNFATTISTNNIERMRVNAGGLVGIGTTTPTDRLHVGSGAVRVNDLGGAGTQMLVVDNGGLISRTAMPDLRLVNTDSHITIDAGVGGTGSNSGGVDVIAIGKNAGNSNAGNSNVFIGTNAGFSNTTAGGNTAIGINALRSNTTGEHSVAIGSAALNFNTTGTANLAIGVITLRNNTTGTYNVALGSYSLQSNTIGNDNSVVGVQALANNLSGNGNVAFGTYAAYRNTTGSNNLAAGTLSFYDNTTGSSNVAIGVNTLRYNTTGNNNVALGLDSGNAITTGSNNTFLGFGADAIGNNLSNTTAIGYLAKVSASNSIVLGGTGVNAVNVGIGTTTPTDRLHVVGGSVRVNNLGGAGTQMLVVDNGGLISRTAMPPANNMYTADGTLTGGRTVTQGANNLVFSGSAPIFKFSGATNSNSLFVLGRAVAEADFGVAGVAGDGLSNVAAGDFWMKVSSGKLSLGTSNNFGTTISTNNLERFRVDALGNVGIGITAPTAKLHVIGNVIATGGYADYVLEDYVDGASTLNATYARKSLEEVDSFIKTNKHLPGVTAIKDLKIADNGEYEIDITKLQVQLLEKVEELYLHTIEQQKQMKEQQKEIDALKLELSQIKK